jgi:hypothetical protein
MRTYGSWPARTFAGSSTGVRRGTGAVLLLSQEFESESRAGKTVPARLSQQRGPRARRRLLSGESTCARMRMRARNQSVESRDLRKRRPAYETPAVVRCRVADPPAHHQPDRATSQPSGYGSGSPRDPGRGAPGLRWRSNSSSRHSTAGVPSIRPPRRAGQSRVEVRERRPRRTTRRIT